MRCEKMLEEFRSSHCTDYRSMMDSNRTDSNQGCTYKNTKEQERLVLEDRRRPSKVEQDWSANASSVWREPKQSERLRPR